MTEAELELAAALYLMIYEAHRSYANTAGWRGGIGGQAITFSCGYIDPAPDQEWTTGDMPSEPLRAFLAANPGVDIKAKAEELKLRWTEWLK